MELLKSATVNNALLIFAGFAPGKNQQGSGVHAGRIPVELKSPLVGKQASTAKIDQGLDRFFIGFSCKTLLPKNFSDEKR